MSTKQERVVALEAIAYGDDPRISPSDRMKALEMLGAQGSGGAVLSEAMEEIAAQVGELSGDALDQELMGFFNPGHEEPPPPPPGSKEAIERKVDGKVRRALRAWAKTQGVRLEPQKAEPRQAPAEPERVAAQTPTAPQPDPEEKRRAMVVRLDNGEVIDTGAPMSQAQLNVAQSKIARQGIREQIREEKRKASPWRDHIPKGMDPAIWERMWG